MLGATGERVHAQALDSEPAASPAPVTEAPDPQPRAGTTPGTTPGTTIDTQDSPAAEAEVHDPAPPATLPARAPATPGKAKKARTTEVGGRVFVRNTMARPSQRNLITPQGWSNRLDLDSVRAGASYRDRDRGLRIDVEAELAGNEVELRDAYVRLQVHPSVRVKAGRFKQPMSAVAMTSRWDLPVVERGLLSDFELGNERTGEPDRLPLGGRRVGAQVELRTESTLEPRIILGVFRSRVHAELGDALGENRAPLGLSQGFPEDIHGRVELTLTPAVVLGTSLGWFGMLDTAGTRDTFRHGFVAGLDVVVDAEPLRLWAEGFVGESPVHFGTNLLAQGQLAALRTIVAMRLSGQEAKNRYLEPYAMVQYLDASSDQDDDTGFEIGGGVNLGLGKSWRIQTAVDHVYMGNRLAGGGTQLIIQLGAVF